jgi:hypothetical protein
MYARHEYICIWMYTHLKRSPSVVDQPALQPMPSIHFGEIKQLLHSIVVLEVDLKTESREA